MALFDEVKNTVSRYIGAQSEKFIERQCRAHLKVEPGGLNSSHVTELAKWVGISAGLILSQDKADELKRDILKLAS